MKKNYSALNLLLAVLFINLFVLALPAIGAPAREFYELKVYSLKTKEQEDRVEAYLKNAYLPAMHRAGVSKVGVFKPIGNDTARTRKIYVMVPMKSLDQLTKLPQALQKDKQYAQAGADYINAAYNNPPYTRMESIIIQAFEMMPQMAMPTLKGSKSERVYELRSYEGHTEKIYQNKVQMFNQGGEVNIFKNLGFNAVFYGEVIAGSTMPNLMYMTTFEDRPTRDAKWKSFSNDPAWKVLSAKPEYKNNVSKNVTLFLRPVEFSDI
ncbi:MAG: family containing protein [Adhaeribacter sp.]|nr:family containing protein [Adhaeribacter sp.]